MNVLGIDACLGNCSVALIRGDTVVARIVEEMARGHVERLAPMVAEVMEQASVSAEALDLIGVTCGPGGFTGARLGAAFARGLALASGCRSIGVTTLQALAFPYDGPRIVALDGRRGDIFAQVFGSESGDSGPIAIPAEEFPDFIARHGSPQVIGPQSLPAIDPGDVARIAMMDGAVGIPRPLYLRAPDAKVSVRPVLR